MTTATQVQRRRGSTAQTNAFTGAVAEVTVDTDTNSLVVHDGVTAGGHRQATELLVSMQIASIATGAAQLLYFQENTIYP